MHMGCMPMTKWIYERRTAISRKVFSKNKMHTTSPKGVVGTFNCTVSRFWYFRKIWENGTIRDGCLSCAIFSGFPEMPKSRNVKQKLPSTFPDGQVHFYPTTFLEITVAAHENCNADWMKWSSQRTTSFQFISFFYAVPIYVFHRFSTSKKYIRKCVSFFITQ